MIELCYLASMSRNDNLTGEALIAAMQASPHREIDIEPERAAMPVRPAPSLFTKSFSKKMDGRVKPGHGG